MKRITHQARRQIEKINRRRAKGYTYAEIAEELGFPGPAHLSSWLRSRAVEIDGVYIPKDRIAAKAEAA